MTKKTLYLIISCCMEESRYEILQQVIDNLQDEQQSKSINIIDDLVAFDNGSTHQNSVELLKGLGCTTYGAKQNLGYWSSIKWVLDNLHTIRDDHKRFEYIYIIESDHFHFALERIKHCETCLERNKHLGSIRTQEYSVKERHLYDKGANHPLGRSYAWVSHVNAITGEPVNVKLLDEETNVYESNFLTCLHSVNRLQALRSVFDQLSNMQSFSELDFQRKYHELYPIIGQIDGGVFHARLGFTPQNPRMLSGSWSTNVAKFGYRETRYDSILPYEPGSVTRLR